MLNNVLPLYLKQTFPPMIWIFTEGEGDEIKSRLPFKIFFTLLMEAYLNDLDAADSFQACDLSEAVRDLAEAVHDLAEAVLDIPASKPLNFVQYFVALQVGKVAIQNILDQMVWISLRVQLQCHLHRNHQQDLGDHSYVT